MSVSATPNLPVLNFIDPETAKAITKYLDDMYFCFRAPETASIELGKDKFDQINTAQIELSNYARARLYGTICATEGPIKIAQAVDGQRPASPIVSVERIVHLRILYGHFAFNYYNDAGLYATFGSLTKAITELGIGLSASSLYRLIDRYAMRGWYWTDPTEKDERSSMIAPTRMATREWRMATVCYLLGTARHKEWVGTATDIADFMSVLRGYMENWESTFEAEFGVPVEGLKDFDLRIPSPEKFDIKH